MTRTVLVTGAAGYLGCILVPALLKAGFHVIAFDTFDRGDVPLAAFASDRKFEPVRADVRDEGSLRSAMCRADVLIPLAARVGAPACANNPLDARSTNLEAIRSLIELKSADQILIYPTTASSYGNVGNAGACSEETPLNPVSLYGSTKSAAEQLVVDGGHGVALRLSTLFGMSPRMRLDLLVNHLTYRAMTERAVVVLSANAKRNFVHVSDAASAFLHVIDRYATARGQIYNVGLSTGNVSKNDICARIQQQIADFIWLEASTGADSDPRDYTVSSEKLEATGWKPRHTLDDGISELIKGYSMLGHGRLSNA